MAVATPAGSPVADTHRRAGCLIAVGVLAFAWVCAAAATCATQIATASDWSWGDSHRLTASFSSEIRIGQSPLDAYVPGSQYKLDPGGRIAATTNGGTNWSVLSVPTTEHIHDVAFPSANRGYAVSTHGVVFRTDDGGLTWMHAGHATVTNAWLLAPDTDTVLLTGPKGIRRSTDAGANFALVDATLVVGHGHGKPLTSKLSSEDLSSGAEAVGGTLFAYGPERLVESTDGGVGWSVVRPPAPNPGYESISFVSASTGYVISSINLFATHDAGRHWSEILSTGYSLEAEPQDIAFSSALDGYAEGTDDLRSALLRTENGGRTWTPEVIPNPDIWHLAATGPVDYAVAGDPAGDPAGGLFHTTDGGIGPVRSTLTLSIRGPRRVSRAELARAGNKVTLTGRLSPAASGEKVMICYLGDLEGHWRHKQIAVGPGGGFKVRVPNIRFTTYFVAQSMGSTFAGGAGTPVTRLTVGR